MNPDLRVDADLARKIVTGFLRTEITRAGYSHAVLNLSGGLDSAVVCALAVEAIGAENVQVLCLPYGTTSPDSIRHAQLMIDQFKVPSETIEITAVVEPLFKQDPKMSRTRRGNIMARARMILLYDRSEVFKALPIGTSNKTEILLGYTTLWGDMCCALNPIGDLYKTQVRQLARALNIPEPIIGKPPSAELWEGQTDEEELGFTYEKVDQLMYLLVDKRFLPQDCIEAGFEEVFVKKVTERIRQSQYKRMMPPIAKLSNRTVGYDFLYLRDWGT
jgi:NAD+ synthase